MQALPLFTYAQLLSLAQRSAHVGQACNCSAALALGWSGWPIGLKEAQLQPVGTLAEFDEEEATLDEYHPAGTYYWSTNAPIAPRYYPYNQCGLWACSLCQRVFLRYNDDGAYHSEARIRRLTPELLVDAAHRHGGRYPPG